MTFVLASCLLAAMSCEKETGNGNNDGNGNGDGQDNITALAAPTGLLAETDAATRSATLSWNAVDDAKSYGLVVNDDTLAAFGTSYTVYDLAYDTPYTWQVRAQNGTRRSAWTSGDAFELQGDGGDDGEREESIPAPTSLTYTLSSSTGTTVILTWNAVEGADSYDVRIGGVTTPKITTNQLTYPAERLKTYTWQVRARKGSKYGAWSAEATFRVEAAPVPAPTGLHQQLNANKKGVTLSWTPNPEADGYEIELTKTVGASKSTQKFTSTAGQQAVSNLTSNAYYAWRVRAKKGSTPGAWSKNSYFSTLTTPLIDRFAGNWSTNNAVILFKAGDSESLNLDQLLNRDHPTGAVTVAVSGQVMTVSGMDNYIVGSKTSSTPFNIDAQLANVQLDVNNDAETVSATVDISSNNVYTSEPKVKIGNVPLFVDMLDKTSMGSFEKALAKAGTINEVAIQVNSVTVTGSLSGASSAVWSLVYDVTVVSIETSIDGLIPAEYKPLTGLIPTPQQLLSDVETTK
jgi:hypothetical protein